jgi:hypothetical protein
MLAHFRDPTRSHGTGSLDLNLRGTIKFKGDNQTPLEQPLSLEIVNPPGDSAECPTKIGRVLR